MRLKRKGLSALLPVCERKGSPPIPDYYGEGGQVLWDLTLTLPLTCWVTLGGFLALSGPQSRASPWKVPTSTVFRGVSFQAIATDPSLLV